MNASQSRPFFGYHMPNFTFPGVPDEGLFGRVVELAQAAEAAGFDLVTVMDHFYQITGVGPEGPADARGLLDPGRDRRQHEEGPPGHPRDRA